MASPLTRTALLALVAMVAFAANSLLCRQALAGGGMDPASFTALRLGSGAVTLWLLTAAAGRPSLRPDWRSAAALFLYAACFSFAYTSLSAGTGALVLFAAVQGTMIGAGLRAGERLTRGAVTGLLLAVAGLVYLVAPGVTAPPAGGTLLMAVAGIAWGVYSLRGRGETDPMGATAGNFLGAVPFGLLVLGGFALGKGALTATTEGVVLAVTSGAVASGLGYAVWYAALRGLAATRAATIQLSVPVIAALGGIALLGEPLTVRFALAATAILGGIALVIGRPRPRPRPLKG